MSEIRYVCEGSCNSQVTIKEFKQGKNKCPIKNCENYNQRLERGEYCSNCNTSFEEGEAHICL